MNKTDEVLEKLQKVMALANGRGATQGEMEAALARAKDIALKYGIDLASVPAPDETTRRSRVHVETRDTLRTSTRYEHPYHNWVFCSLEHVFGVRFLLSRIYLGSHPYLLRIFVIGEPADVAIAVTLFPWLEKMFPQCLGEAIRLGQTSRSFADQNGFYMGLNQGIVEVNRREEEKLNEQDRTTWALLVRTKKDLIEQEMQKFKPKEKKGRKSYSEHARIYGERKGRSIHLHQMAPSI